MAVVAVTERLELSDVSPASDLDAFQRFLTAESHWRHVPIETPTPDWVAEFLRGQALAATREPRDSFYLAVRTRGSGEFVGDASLRRWDAVSGDIGWGVIAPARGQGYATEIGSAMRELGFRHLGLHRVCALCREGNLASRAVMLKLGMQFEGTMREHFHVRGEWWSSWVSAILAHDPRPYGAGVEFRL